MWVIFWRWNYTSHPDGEVYGMVVTTLCTFGVVETMFLVGLFVDFRWSVNISLRMGILEAQDGTVVVVSGPCLPA